jgi:hypothetical protein
MLCLLFTGGRGVPNSFVNGALSTASPFRSLDAAKWHVRSGRGLELSITKEVKTGVDGDGIVEQSTIRFDFS